MNPAAPVTRYRAKLLAADAVVGETAALHLLRVVEVAAVEEHRLLQEREKAVEVGEAIEITRQVLASSNPSDSPSRPPLAPA